MSSKQRMNEEMKPTERFDWDDYQVFILYDCGTSSGVKMSVSHALPIVVLTWMWTCTVGDGGRGRSEREPTRRLVNGQVTRQVRIFSPCHVAD